MAKPELQKLIRQIIKEEIVKESAMSNVDILADECLDKLAKIVYLAEPKVRQYAKEILIEYAAEVSKISSAYKK